MGNVKEVEDEEALRREISNLQIGSHEAEAGDDDEETDDLLVGLGFVQPVEHQWKVARQQFPSKVGGCPAWLDPINIPSGAQSNCGICDSPLDFLLQVYAPIDGQNEAFHRTILVFICSNMACLQQDQHHQCKQPAGKPCRSVKVFRSQLPRNNPFYSYTPPANERDLPACDGVALCTWCGTWKGQKACAACKQARYCSRNHQVEHWRGGHAVFCRQEQAARKANQPAEGNTQPTTNGGVHEDVSAGAGPASDTLWPEMELVVDEEDNYEDDEEDYENATVQNLESAQSRAQRLLEDYEIRLKAGEDFSAADLQDVHEASQDMQLWAAFLARIARAPDQVLRYCRSLEAKPLWLSSKDQPKSTNIPACVHCGSRRIFEFQVLPQLLNYLQVKNEPSSLDWGTIAVYSCEHSCGAGVSKGYAEEFAWVQMPPE